MLYILKGAQNMMIPIDEICCWVRKEYSTRTFLRVYSNRIETNNPGLRYVYLSNHNHIGNSTVFVFENTN